MTASSSLPESEHTEGHVLSVCSSFTRPGQWVECSCGWASPDLQFPTDAEAIAWARKEHGLA